MREADGIQFQSYTRRTWMIGHLQKIAQLGNCRILQRYLPVDCGVFGNELLFSYIAGMIVGTHIVDPSLLFGHFL